MALTLQYTYSTSVPVEIEGVTPTALRSLSLAEIQQIEAFEGNRKIPLGELFQIAGDPGDLHMVFEGDLSGVHWIGAGMTEGAIRVEGEAGRHLGSEMSGGRIDVAGDAGDWVGGEMHGGLIHVRGRAGHLVGAAYRGSRVGMTRGTILIGGDVGNEVGHTMRRGTIVVGGGMGDTAGFNMIAGTILALGNSGIRHGAGMRRGTIGLLGDEPPLLLPTFKRACRYQPEFLKMILASLRKLEFEIPSGIDGAELDIYSGDMIEGGRGEILVKAA